MYTGIIAFASGKGWYFAEKTDDSTSVFVHQNDIVGGRRLRVDDRIEFDLAPNPRHPGKFCAVNVRYLGHSIARQVSGTAAQS
jgi:cold shock CspA family protein